MLKDILADRFSYTALNRSRYVEDASNWTGTGIEVASQLIAEAADESTLVGPETISAKTISFCLAFRASISAHATSSRPV